jgi:CheY-like chemotaxis protein
MTVEEGSKKSVLVLVVEDEPLIRMMAADALADAGFAVLEAEDADAALLHLNGRSSDVVVLCTDVHMPGAIDGLALAHHVFVNWPWIALLVMSGKARPGLAELPSGARFLAKPYEVEALVSHVAEMAV